MKNRLIAFVIALAVLFGAAGCTAQEQKQNRISITMYLWDRNMSKALTPWLAQTFPKIDFTFVMGYNTMYC